jgi:hypothetical protein
MIWKGGDVWTNIENDTSTIYKMIKFGDIVIKKPQYGANVRGVKKTYKYKIY